MRGWAVASRLLQILAFMLRRPSFLRKMGYVPSVATSSLLAKRALHNHTQQMHLPWLQSLLQRPNPWQNAKRKRNPRDDVMTQLRMRRSETGMTCLSLQAQLQRLSSGVELQCPLGPESLWCVRWHQPKNRHCQQSHIGSPIGNCSEA